MLKPSEETPPPRAERPVGEIVHELIEDGKSYARAEIGLAKAVATAKGKALALPAGLLLGAMIVIQAAVVMLAFTLFGALVWLLGTVVAGLVTFVIFSAIAAGMAWYGVQRARRDL
jgi:hypothetical protein